LVISQNIQDKISLQLDLSSNKGLPQTIH